MKLKTSLLTVTGGDPLLQDACALVQVEKLLFYTSCNIDHNVFFSNSEHYLHTFVSLVLATVQHSDFALIFESSLTN